MLVLKLTSQELNDRTKSLREMRPRWLLSMDWNSSLNCCTCREPSVWDTISIVIFVNGSASANFFRLHEIIVIEVIRATQTKKR